MPLKKVRMDLYDDNGNKYTIIFEGGVTREKVLQLLDLVELLGGSSSEKGYEEENWNKRLTKLEKLRLTAERHYPLTWFSSKELQHTYEEEFDEPISLSTTSTYLSRLADRGFFIRDWKNNKLRYRLFSNTIENLKMK
jgi:hypothetical protein